MNMTKKYNKPASEQHDMDIYNIYINDRKVLQYAIKYNKYNNMYDFYNLTDNKKITGLTYEKCDHVLNKEIEYQKTIKGGNKKMKMTKENYNIILKVFKDNKQLITDHKQNLLNNATFKDLNIRLAFDVWHSTLISREVKNNIMQYGSSDELNDNHLQTALLKALNEIGLKEDN